jgi:hypothetical protein
VGPNEITVGKGQGGDKENGQDFLGFLNAGALADAGPGRGSPSAIPGDDGAGFPGGTVAAQAQLAPVEMQPQIPSQSPPFVPDGRLPVDSAASRLGGVSWAGNVQLPPGHNAATATTNEAVTLTRVFEQHWFANGYLSIVDNMRNGRPSPDSRAIGATSRSEVPVASATTAALVPMAVSGSSGQPPAPGPWPVLMEAPAGIADDQPQSVERLARALGPLIVADQPWPESLLRVCPRPGGKVSLWLRDYSLPPQSIPPLVDRLRQQALSAGIALERVVVNGNTAWQSDSKGDA